MTDREAVLAGLHREQGLLRRAVEVQAFAPKRMSRKAVEAGLRQLQAEGLVVRREPFDRGLPDRWGLAPASREQRPAK